MHASQKYILSISFLVSVLVDCLSTGQDAAGCVSSIGQNLLCTIISILFLEANL